MINSSQNPKEYWKNILKHSCKKKKRSNHETLINDDCIDLDRQITDDEIIASIKYIHSNRSPGPDEICIEIIKATLNEIVPSFVFCLMRFMTRGIFPSGWCDSIICPIHVQKSGSNTNLENFRGITLINRICNGISYILAIRLQTWAETQQRHW